MEKNSEESIGRVLSCIEENLFRKPDLNMAAHAAHYSRYHLHRMFTRMTGMPLYSYMERRRLTEAAKLLVYSQKPILEIALLCGYESQQAFTGAFRSMYKLPPAAFRRRKEFYPLQLPIRLAGKEMDAKAAASFLRPAEMDDIPEWMELVRQAADGLPCLNEIQHKKILTDFIQKGRAFLIKPEGEAAGAMGFSPESGHIDFLVIHPRYRNSSLEGAFLEMLRSESLPERPISITTYRQNDRADTGHRKRLLQLGFGEGELLFEFGYPTQRLVFPPSKTR